jgi:hypothetical protein
VAFKASENAAAAFGLIIHIGVAVALFCTITAAAVILNLLIGVCEAHTLAPVVVIWGMKALEFFLWAADVLCFLLFVAVEVWKFCVTVWDGRGG